jgi:hypothetical protein
MKSKCDKHKDLIIELCESGSSYSEIAGLLPEKIATGTV